MLENDVDVDVNQLAVGDEEALSLSELSLYIQPPKGNDVFPVPPCGTFT